MQNLRCHLAKHACGRTKDVNRSIVATPFVNACVVKKDYVSYDPCKWSNASDLTHPVVEALLHGCEYFFHGLYAVVH